MGVSIEGSEAWWPESQSEAVLPEMNNYDQGKRYIDVFNLGKTTFNYSIDSNSRWLSISSPTGSIDTEERIWIDMDWENADLGNTGCQ